MKFQNNDQAQDSITPADILSLVKCLDQVSDQMINKKSVYSQRINRRSEQCVKEENTDEQEQPFMTTQMLQDLHKVNSVDWNSDVLKKPRFQDISQEELLEIITHRPDSPYIKSARISEMDDCAFLRHISHPAYLSSAVKLPDVLNRSTFMDDLKKRQRKAERRRHLRQWPMNLAKTMIPSVVRKAVGNSHTVIAPKDEVSIVGLEVAEESVTKSYKVKYGFGLKASSSKTRRSVEIGDDYLKVFRRNGKVKFNLKLANCTVRENSTDNAVQVISNTAPKNLNKKNENGGMTVQLFMESEEGQKELRQKIVELAQQAFIAQVCSL